MGLPGKIQDRSAAVQSFRVVKGVHIDCLCLADDINYGHRSNLTVSETYHSSEVLLDNQVYGCYPEISSILLS
jgi:hypothetical protein